MKMSAKEYRAFLLNTQGKTSSHPPNKREFSFQVIVEKITDHSYKITLTGRHYSTNAINSFHFREKLRYKTAIKEAFIGFIFQGKNRFTLKPKAPFKKARLDPFSFCRKSRDDDGNFITIKTLRDCLTEHGYIVDDSRKHLSMSRDVETVGKIYKIEMILTEEVPG